MRLVYSIILYLISPLLPLYLKKRGKKNPDYLDNWHERFGLSLVNLSTKPIIWLHSVSVGETRAMQKIVELINCNFPNYQVLITTMTPTGRATAKNLYPEAIVHYVPYDLSFSVKRFYTNFKPHLGIILETEIWPNLIHFAEEYAVLLYLVNARLSNKSYRGYRRFKWMLMPVLNKLSGVFCQDESTKDNFRQLNYTGKLEVVGNTKFDLVVSTIIQNKIIQFKQLFNGRKVITFASTRDGEEELILNNIRLEPGIIYLFIPRHPERFSLIEQLLCKCKIKYQRRSELTSINSDTQVIIGDSMGEMLAYYAISHLAIIGGSFKEFGGQNPIEAIFMHVPVIFGNSMFNFREVAINSVNLGCAIQLLRIEQLNDTLVLLMNSELEYNKIKSNCSDFIVKYQGASQRIFDLIKDKL